MVLAEFPHHPGNVDLSRLPTTADQAKEARFCTLGDPRVRSLEDASEHSPRPSFTPAPACYICTGFFRKNCQVAINPGTAQQPGRPDPTIDLA